MLSRERHSNHPLNANISSLMHSIGISSFAGTILLLVTHTEAWISCPPSYLLPLVSFVSALRLTKGWSFNLAKSDEISHHSQSLVVTVRTARWQPCMCESWIGECCIDIQVGMRDLVRYWFLSRGEIRIIRFPLALMHEYRHPCAISLVKGETPSR